MMYLAWSGISLDHSLTRGGAVCTWWPLIGFISILKIHSTKRIFLSLTASQRDMTSSNTGMFLDRDDCLSPLYWFSWIKIDFPLFLLGHSKWSFPMNYLPWYAISLAPSRDPTGATYTDCLLNIYITKSPAFTIQNACLSSNILSLIKTNFITYFI